MAGTPAAVLAHTMLGKEIHNVYLDGERMGEIRVNSLLAGHFGVPVAFISGDTACCAEARGLLGDDLPAFAVKDGIDMFAATCLSREATDKGIRSGVAEAVSAASLGRRRPYRLPGEHRYAIEWNTTTIAAICALIPGMKRIDSRTTEYTTADVTEAMAVFIAEYTIAMQVGQRRAYG
jgi:D-amino peptidase